MKCMKCGEEAFKSTTTEAIELGFGVLVIRNVSVGINRPPRAA